MRPRHIAVFALLGLIWGSEWLVVRHIELPPLQALAIRYAIAFLVLAAGMRFRRQRLPRGKTLLIAGCSGVTLLALPAVLTAWGSQQISPGSLVVIAAMTPLIAALLEGRAGGSLMAPLVGGVAGTALIASQGLSFAPRQWAGATAVLAAAVLVAASVVYVKRELLGLAPEWIAMVQLGAAAIVAGTVSWFADGPSLPAFTWRSALAECGLALFANALVFPLYYWLLRGIESYQLTAMSWVTLVVAVAEGLIFVRSGLSARIFIGTAILLISLWLLWRFRRGDDAPLTLEITSPRSDS